MNIPRQSPLKQARRHCLYCLCNRFKMIRFCHHLNCPLWYFRFGKYPRTYINENGKKVEQLFDQENFKKGAKFSHDIETSEYRL